MFSNYLPKNRAVYEIMWKHFVQTDRQTDRPQTTRNTSHALCVLDK